VNGDPFDPPARPLFDRLGRYLLPDPETGAPCAWTRVTTFAKTISDTYHLDAWRRRTMLAGLLARPDLLAEASYLDRDKRALNALCEQAMEAGGASDGRRWGTLMHEVTEQADRGEMAEVPVEMVGDFLAYQRALTEGGILILSDYIERRVVVPGLGVAGTLDRIVRMPDGSMRIADLKTAADMSYSWLETSIQLACYASADHLWVEDSLTYEAMPDIDRSTGLIIHLPAGRGECALYDLNLDAGRSAAAIVQTVRNLRKSRNLATPRRP
jgi:hypothetical protein